MSVDRSSMVLTKRGAIRYTDVTTDDETLVRGSDGLLTWTPITGVSVDEQQIPFVGVETSRIHVSCSYDQRWWMARRAQSGRSTKLVVSTIPDSLQQDRLLISGSYMESGNNILSPSEARLYALMVAGRGELYERDDVTHISLHESATQPGWYLRAALEGIETRTYGDEWVVTPNKSRRMQRLLRRPLFDVMWDMDAVSREEFLMAYFSAPVEKKPSLSVSILAFLCNQMIVPHVRTYSLEDGVVLLQHSDRYFFSDQGFTVHTEAGGYTIVHAGQVTVLPA